MEGTGHKSQEGSQQQQLQGQNTGKLSVACLSLENDGETSRGAFSLCRWKWRLRAPAWAGAWMSALALVTWCPVRSCYE